MGTKSDFSDEHEKMGLRWENRIRVQIMWVFHPFERIWVIGIWNKQKIS